MSPHKKTLAALGSSLRYLYQVPKMTVEAKEPILKLA